MSAHVHGRCRPLPSLLVYCSRSERVLAILVLAFGLQSVFTEARTASTNEQPQKLTIAVAGNSEGNLEICGCPRSPAGGLARRAWVLNRYRRAGRAVLAVETGGFWRGDEPIDTERTLTYLHTLEAMQWGPVLLGKTEFEHGRDNLEDLISGSLLPFVATNVKDASGSVTPWKREWLAEVAGFRVGVLGITRGATPEIMLRDHLVVGDPLQVLSEEIPHMRPQVDILIVLTDVGPDLGRELCTSVLGIDLLVNQGSDLIYQKSGATVQVFASYQGKYLRLVSVSREGTQDSISYGIREKLLEADGPEDPAVRGLIDGWYADVAARPEYAWNGVLTQQNGSESDAVYVGAESCAPCHQRDYYRWKAHPHEKAMLVLLIKQRHFLPRCQPCHVTGYGEEGGFEGGRPDHPMKGVQCEACHGPGSAHASEPEGEAQMQIPTRQTCERCHDAENSPRFAEEFERYWKEGKHGG